MTTPTGPRASDPIDGMVRQLLWRLRARLVTPPDEQRAQADLDRLFAAARDLAHDAPSADASVRPPAHPAGSRPDHAIRAASSHDPVAPDPVTVETAGVPDVVAHRRSRRRWLPGASLGRVAAGVVVLAVATGIAGARDGAVTLQALLGRDDAPVVTDEPGDEDPVGDLALEPQRPEEPDAADPGEGSDDAAPDPHREPPAVDLDPPESAGTTDPPAGDDPEVEPESAPSEDRSGDDSGGQDGGSTGSGSGTDQSGSGGRVIEEVPADADPGGSGEEIIAAPDPATAPDDGLSGFGGPRPCHEADLADCLPAPDESVDDDAGAPESDDPGTADQPAADDAPDDSTGTDGLASRRFGGSSSTSPDADEPTDDR